MHSICLCLLICMSLCNGQELNSAWKKTDDLVKNVETLYNNLALTVEDAGDKQKRAFSIMLTGILQFVASDGNRTASAVDLSQPADVFAASTRSQADVIRSVLDPAIAVVKTACPPEASELGCLNAQIKAELQQTLKCISFYDHVRFRIASEKFVADATWQGFLADMLEVSETGDDDTALKYLSDVEDGKRRRGLLPRFKEWFLTFATGNFICNLPPTGIKFI